MMRNQTRFIIAQRAPRAMTEKETHPHKRLLTPRLELGLGLGLGLGLDLGLWLSSGLDVEFLVRAGFWLGAEWYWGWARVRLRLD